MKKEFCIMPKDVMYETERTPYTVRHEVFFGSKNRKKSIEDGLVVFLTPEMHNMSDKGVHFNKEFDNYLKKIAQRTWQKYYNKSEQDFIKRYGRSYL